VISKNISLKYGYIGSYFLKKKPLYDSQPVLFLLPSGKISPPKKCWLQLLVLWKILQYFNWPGQKNILSKNSLFEKNHQISKKNLYRGFFIEN
jgi:hypothetical protein